MKVILLDNIRGVGMVGDIKDVTDGYARNFLLPRRLARLASAQAAQHIEQLKNKKLAEIEVAKENARKVAEFLKDITFTITARANEKGTLFEGIEAKDIAEKIRTEKGVHVTPDQVLLPQHIKTIGEHVIPIELAPDITVEVKLNISAE